MNQGYAEIQAEVEMLAQTIGKRLNIVRMQNGIKQQTFAAFIGVSSQQIAKYEKGQNRITAGALCKVAKSLQIPVSVFFPQSGEVVKLETMGKTEAEFILFLRQMPNYKQLRIFEVLKFYAAGDRFSRLDMNDDQMELMILNKL